MNAKQLLPQELQQQIINYFLTNNINTSAAIEEVFNLKKTSVDAVINRYLLTKKPN